MPSMHILHNISFRACVQNMQVKSASPSQGGSQPRFGTPWALREPEPAEAAAWDNADAERRTASRPPSRAQTYL